MTKILTRGGNEWNESLAKGAVGAIVAYRFGVRLDGRPVNRADLIEENPELAKQDSSMPPYDIIERYRAAIPAVKIENGIITFNPIITL